MFKVMPDDPIILEMDPVQKIWMFYNWIEDQNDKVELTKNHAYLLGSFSNPEAVKQYLNGNVHESTDEEFEESTRLVKENIFNSQKPKENKISSRRKRTLKGING